MSLPYCSRSSVVKFRVLASLVLAGTCLCVIPLVAQQGRGIIAGHVTDISGAMLPGARVELQPLASSSKSDERGQYTLANVPTGGYTLVVSYVGFTTFNGTVNVAAGQVARVDVQMKVGSRQDEINVTADRVHGEAEAVNRTRASDNILQVLPVEVITSLPNTNIADALGRLPSVTLERDEGEGKYVQIRGLEPRLSNVTIDGVNVPSPESGVRQIKLDVIPANLVDSVEINKTLSANQDGDAIAGSVNLVTKTAEDRTTLYLNGLGGYTPIIGGRPAYETDGTVGRRFGANKRLGLLIGGSYDWNGRAIDDVEPAVQVSQCDATGCDGGQTGAFYPTYQTLDIREYKYYRERYGFAGSVDYKLGEISGLYARFLYSHFNNFGDRWVYSPEIGSFSGAPANLGNADGVMSFNTQIRRPVEVIGSLDAGGKHVFANWALAYDLSAARSSSEDRGYASADFGVIDGGPLTQIVFAVDRSNPFRPNLIPQGGANIYDSSQYFLQDLDVSKTYSPQLNLQGGFSAARNYRIGQHFATFEFGGKIRNAHKFQDSNELVYNAAVDSANPDNAFLMSQFLGNFRNSDYYDRSYTLGPTTDFGKIRSFFNANTSLFGIDPNETHANNDPNNFDLVERVSAGYLMNTLQLGRIRLQTGLRFEATNEDIVGSVVNFDSNGDWVSTSSQRRTSSYLDVLPSVQVRFDLGHDAAIRASYGRGISRPNFSDLPPFFSADASGPALSIGNPDLKPTHANNYDLLFEKYLKPLGLIQAGFFYKQLSDPIFGTRGLITDPAQFGTKYVGFELDQQINGSDARLYGFEISYQQHLTFLPGPLGGFGISANYSYTNSRIDSLPFRTDTPSLARQAPNSWNISPTYDRGRLSARLGISHNDANIFEYHYENLSLDDTGKTVPNPQPLGIKGPNGDVYLYGHTQVDAQAAFRMYKGLQFIASGLNLTNEVFGFYQGDSQFPIQREFYKPTYSFGLRYTFSNEPR